MVVPTVGSIARLPGRVASAGAEGTSGKDGSGRGRAPGRQPVRGRGGEGRGQGHRQRDAGDVVNRSGGRALDWLMMEVLPRSELGPKAGVRAGGRDGRGPDGDGGAGSRRRGGRGGVGVAEGGRWRGVVSGGGDRGGGRERRRQGRVRRGRRPGGRRGGRSMRVEGSPPHAVDGRAGRAGEGGTVAEVVSRRCSAHAHQVPHGNRVMG